MKFKFSVQNLQKKELIVKKQLLGAVVPVILMFLLLLAAYVYVRVGIAKAEKGREFVIEQIIEHWGGGPPQDLRIYPALSEDRENGATYTAYWTMSFATVDSRGRGLFNADYKMIGKPHYDEVVPMKRKK